MEGFNLRGGVGAVISDFNLGGCTTGSTLGDGAGGLVMIGGDRS